MSGAWERVKDAHGRVFYVNHVTRETSWHLPTNDPLPPGWQELKDPEGRVYFVDHNTKRTTWMDPRMAARTRAASRSNGATPMHANGNGTNGYNTAATDGRASQMVVPTYNNVNTTRMSDDSDSSAGRNNNGTRTRGDSGFAAASRVPTNVGHLAANGDSRVSVLNNHNNSSERESGLFSPVLDETIRFAPSMQLQPTNTLAKKPSDLVQNFPPPAGSFATNAVNARADGSVDTSAQNLALQMRLRRYFAPILVRDDTVVGCMQCNSKFGVLRRRHHCKLCGNVFCAECIANKVLLPIDGPGYEQKQPVCQRCFRNVEAGDFYSFIALRRLLDEPARTVDEKAEQMLQLATALKTGRDETMRGMGLHRIAQLNDIEAAGGVASFCQLLQTDVEELQKASLEMLANLIALENSAGNELAAGEAVAQSGACQSLVQVMGNRVMELQLGGAARPEVERKALRVVFHICKSRACQVALRKAGAGNRLCELLAADSPAALETKIEAARCLKKYVRKSTDNILELTARNGVSLLCDRISAFLALRASSTTSVADSKTLDELLDVALEALLSTVCECIHVSEVHGAQSVVLQIPATAIASFVAILQQGDRMNRVLASQVLVHVSQEPTMIATIATERTFLTEMLWLLDSDDDASLASEILYGLCQTTPQQPSGSTTDNVDVDIHETMLRVLFELNVLDVVLKKLQACVIANPSDASAPPQFVGEITFQKHLLGIVKCFSAESAAYADYIVSRGCVAALAAFLLSKKSSLIPLAAQTLMNLCEFIPSIFSELLDRNASDFFHRLLQTPPDENRYSALRYFSALLDSDRGFAVGVLDTLFVMASGRDATLKTKSLEVLAKLTGITSITTLLEPVPMSTNPEIVTLVTRLRERVVGPAVFPGLMTLISAASSSSSDTNASARVNAIKCIRCAIDGGDDTVARMVELDVFRVFCVVMRKWMDPASLNSSSSSSSSRDSIGGPAVLPPTEKQISTAVLQLLYLILHSSTALIASAGEDDVVNLVTVVTEFIVSQPSRLAMGIRIVRLFIAHRTWKNCFFTLYAADATATGHAFLQALMNGIEQSSATARTVGTTTTVLSPTTTSTPTVVGPTDTVLDDCLTVLHELVRESSNDAMVNLLISAGVHTSLLELVRCDSDSVSVQQPSPLVTRALELLDALAQTRRVRLLILEAGPALASLVALYDTLTLAFADAEVQQQATAEQLGRVLVHLALDPLAFRKMLYDHRNVLPGAILRNILSPVDSVAQAAEDVVLALVDSDFATCPLWIDVIEAADIQLAYRVLVVAKRASVQVVAARKLTDIVFSTPSRLRDPNTGLSDTERSTLVSTLIRFLVDFDPRTSVIGVLALTLLLRHGETLTADQMHDVAVDGALSLVYWMQKGTERHQENVVTILYDGVPDAAALTQFYDQLEAPEVARATAFVVEMAQQIVDCDALANPQGVAKRVVLLTGMLARKRNALTALAPESREALDEVTVHLLAELAKDSETHTSAVEAANSDIDEPDSVIEVSTQDDASCLAAVDLTLHVLQFFAVLGSTDALRQDLVARKNAVPTLVVLLQRESVVTSPATRAAAQQLLQQLCCDDIAPLIAAGGVDVLLSMLSASKTDDDEYVASAASDATHVLALLNGVASTGKAGRQALMQSTAATAALEHALAGVLQVNADTDAASLTVALVADDCAAARTACGVCALVFRLSRARAFRLQLVTTSDASQFVALIVTFLAWLASSWNAAASIAADATRVLTDGLAFLDAVVVAEQQRVTTTDSVDDDGIDSRRVGMLHQVWRVAIQALQTFADGHTSAALYRSGCELLAALITDCRAAVDASQRAELLALLSAQADAVRTSGSRDALAALLELVLALTVSGAEPTESLEWATDVLVFVLTTEPATTGDSVDVDADSIDLAAPLQLLLSWCRSFALRTALLAHSSYTALVDALASQSQSQSQSQTSSQRNRRFATRALALLGEDDDVDAPERTADATRRSTCALALRCIHCRDVVHVTNSASITTIVCRSCRKFAVDRVVNNDGDAGVSVVTALDSPTDRNDGEGADGNDAVQEINCQNCSKLIAFPANAASSDVACPHCLHSPTISKSASLPPDSVAGGGGNAPNPVTSPTGGAGASGGNGNSVGLVDVRDTKVVSCGHCSKHLIVKNGASAVKCPSCQGVSKLSTTTTQEMMRCQNCNTLLSLPAGARAYKCMKCMHTTRLS